MPAAQRPGQAALPGEQLGKHTRKRRQSTQTASLISFRKDLRINLLREAILRKKMLPFGHCPKGGGVQPESKSFGVVFFGLSFGHFQ